ncbi:MULTISPECIES: response regulator [unclassified Roseateles]|uniref:response regulator n=1 Tax=unclassified Roseateles TaxID=2626991 RepID=UPI0021E3F12D|nr:MULTISPECIES: response regulator [unclassified Roseateles]MCV2419795.1 response regulator [Paucibacter sp. DJ4R-1]MCV2437302.1 response regulator [Paucibacter sp. DJ2R-2]
MSKHQLGPAPRFNIALASGAPGGALKALIIDEGELSRSVISTMLRDMGVQQVHTARRPEQARRQIKEAGHAYDIIITEFHFRRLSNHDMSGQDLLDELRQARGLPMQTIFIMVTDEARYQHVADAVEGALDDYLLKPFTARQFEERLQIILDRKHALREVFAAIEASDYAGAAELCEAMFRNNVQYKVYAARIGSELYLRLGQLDAARRMFEALLEYKAVPWARLGLAKIDLGNADTATACRSLETLLADNPSYVDAYDVYGRALLEEMNFTGAAEMLAKAVQITPGNVARLQKLGSLQLFLGFSESAAKHLMAALNIGSQSRSLDYQGLVALGLACLDEEDRDGCERAARFLQDAQQRFPDSFRVRTLAQTLEVVLALSERRADAAQNGLRQLAAELDHPELSFEMGCNLIMLLVRSAGRQAMPEARAWTERTTQRFAVSRPRTRMLEMAAAAMPPIEAIVRNAAAGINEAAREAMSHLVSKQHERTLQALLELAQRSLNARIINLAHASLKHHGQHLPEATAQRLGMVIDDLHARYTDGGRRFVEREQQS